jgi:hypothetical protein
MLMREYEHASTCEMGAMRVTIDLPDDIHEKVAIEALRKRRNSKEAVMTEILRAHDGGGQPQEKQQELLRWRLSDAEAKRIGGIRHRAKAQWT